MIPDGGVGAYNGTMDTDRDIDWFVALGGTVVVFAAAGILEGVNGTVGSTNVALLLTVVVVASALLGGRRGGATTALSAALSYNFFHTRPIHTLRIASGRDVLTVVLLAVTGVAVGELAQHLRTTSRRARGGRDELRLLHDNAERCRTAPSAGPAVFGSTEALARLLGAEAVSFERGAAPTELGRITHTGTLEDVPLRATPAGYDLGAAPITLSVGAAGRTFGHFLVVPTAGHPVPLDARVGAVVIADQLALALAGLDGDLSARPR